MPSNRSPGKFSFWGFCLCCRMSTHSIIMVLSCMPCYLSIHATTLLTMAMLSSCVFLFDAFQGFVLADDFLIFRFVAIVQPLKNVQIGSINCYAPSIFFYNINFRWVTIRYKSKQLVGMHATVSKMVYLGNSFL